MESCERQRGLRADHVFPTCDVSFAFGCPSQLYIKKAAEGKRNLRHVGKQIGPPGRKRTGKIQREINGHRMFTLALPYDGGR